VAIPIPAQWLGWFTDVLSPTTVTASLFAGSFLLAAGFCSSSTAFRFFDAASGSDMVVAL
jgi:hypothetical protein